MTHVLLSFILVEVVKIGGSLTGPRFITIVPTVSKPDPAASLTETLKLNPA